jgi:Icc-related predicted phosphoesterase
MVKHLYVMSDTHDDLEAVARAVDFAKSEGRAKSKIIHAGDFALRPYTMEAVNNLRETGDVDAFMKSKAAHTDSVLGSYKEILDGSGMPWVAIPGNYDGDLRASFGNSDIHGRTQYFDGIKVVGYGGAGDGDGPWIGPGHMQPLANAGQIQMFNPKELSDLLVRESPTIAVTHSPPMGLCDDMFNGVHVGTPTMTKYIQENDGLRLVISGHIHEAGPSGGNPNRVRGVSGVERVSGERTIVVNPGNLGRFGLLDANTLDPVREFDFGTFARVDIEDDGTPIKVTQYSVQEQGRTVGEVRQVGEYDL